MEDLKLLQRSGMIELRCVEPANFVASHCIASAVKGGADGYQTTPYHSILVNAAPVRIDPLSATRSVGSEGTLSFVRALTGSSALSKNNHVGESHNHTAYTSGESTVGAAATRTVVP
jgi:hypothetical protein